MARETITSCKRAPLSLTTLTFTSLLCFHGSEEEEEEEQDEGEMIGREEEESLGFGS